MSLLAVAAWCLLVAVSDGDTLTLQCQKTPGAAPLSVRVADIDAPERKQAYGLRARDHLRALCLRQPARMTPVDRDSYGRTVARVECRGQDVARAQVGAGMAWVYPHAPRTPDPALQPLQQRARQAQQGLWSQPRPQPPWVYRQRHGAQGRG